MNFFKRIILKIIYGYSTSSDYCKFLKKKGCTIGNNVVFYSPNHISIDITRPYGISIGNNVHITRNVTILTHGFEWSVLKAKYNDVLGSFGPVSIGNNVFIGSNSMILKGVTICDDVIIGACSVVTTSCKQPGVYAGNPAKFICSIDDYYKKRIGEQYKEASKLVSCYYKKFKAYPPKSELDEFFFLFEDEKKGLIDEYKYQMNNNGGYNECLMLLKSGKRRMFNTYDDFLNSCSIDE